MEQSLTLQMKTIFVAICLIAFDLHFDIFDIKAEPFMRKMVAFVRLNIRLYLRLKLVYL